MNKGRIAILQMLLCGLLWSLSGLLVKLLPWNAMVIAGARSILAAAVIGLYMRIRSMRLIRTRQSYWIAVALAVALLTYLHALKLTTAANAIVLQYTAPIFVLLFSWLFRRQRMRRADILTVALTIAGIALCFLDQMGRGSLAGDALALVSGVFFGSMFFASGGVEEETRLSGLLMAQFIIVAVSLPFVFVYPASITAENMLYILLLGFVQLGIPYVLYSLSARYCSALTCVLLSTVQPIVSPLLVYWVIGEKPGAYALYGSALVLVTITLWCVWDERIKHRQLKQDGGQSTARS